MGRGRRINAYGTIADGNVGVWRTFTPSRWDGCSQRALLHRRACNAARVRSRKHWRDRHADARSRSACAYRAARQNALPIGSPGAARRRGTRPPVPTDAAIRLLRAQRGGHTHRAQAHLLRARRAARPNPHVVPCRSACRLYSLACSIVPVRPPNPALQLTASRARSLAFEGFFRRARRS